MSIRTQLPTPSVRLKEIVGRDTIRAMVLSLLKEANKDIAADFDWDDLGEIAHYRYYGEFDYKSSITFKLKKNYPSKKKYKSTNENVYFFPDNTFVRPNTDEEDKQYEAFEEYGVDFIYTFLKMYNLYDFFEKDNISGVYTNDVSEESIFAYFKHYGLSDGNISTHLIKDDTSQEYTVYRLGNPIELDNKNLFTLDSSLEFNSLARFYGDILETTRLSELIFYHEIPEGKDPIVIKILKNKTVEEPDSSE